MHDTHAILCFGKTLPGYDTLAVMLAAGAAWDEAIRVANIAAGIVVGKLGTAVVTRQELLAAL